ncbi:hypothetical protein ACF0H5_009377 [Mactra antiquata]
MNELCSQHADIIDDNLFTTNLSPVKSANASHCIDSVEDSLLNVSADLEIQTEAHHTRNYCRKRFKLAWFPRRHAKSCTQSNKCIQRNTDFSSEQDL